VYVNQEERPHENHSKKAPKYRDCYISPRLPKINVQVHGLSEFGQDTLRNSGGRLGMGFKSEYICIHLVQQIPEDIVFMTIFPELLAEI
jgi:hypothetical protein